MRYTSLTSGMDFQGIKAGEGPTVEHQPDGRATLVSYPSPKSPDDPFIVICPCICGNDACFFNMTSYEASHIHYESGDPNPVYH